MSLLQTRIYKYVLDLYCTEACLTGFRGAHRDANMRMPDVQLIHADDEHGNQDPCQEDEEFFESRPDAATMEEATGKFMDGMEAQERGGFKELHRLLARLPVPTAKASPAMTHKDALEGGFLPSMTEEEQKRFTPSELLLYKHALEYRCEQVHLLFIPMLYQYIHIQTQFIPVHTGTYGCQTKYIPQVDCCRAEKGHCYASAS